MINDYKFGVIVIDDIRYTSDVKIFPDWVIDNWWRKYGHSLVIEDIQDILNNNPKGLIIGTGASGMMKVPEDTQRIVRESGIELIIERTGDACQIYNELSRSQNIVAALHLTC